MACCRHKNRCVDCGGADICQHRRRKYECTVCVGSGICVHGKRKIRCRECNERVCEHGIKKLLCKVCLAGKPALAELVLNRYVRHCKLIQIAVTPPFSPFKFLHSRHVRYVYLFICLFIIIYLLSIYADTYRIS